MDGNLVFWRCHIRIRARGGARDPKLEQFKQYYSLIYMSFYEFISRQRLIINNSYLAEGEQGGLLVDSWTPEQEVVGSNSLAPPCCVLEQDNTNPQF